MAPDAKFRDMILAVRADEAFHREVNHHFADIPSTTDFDLTPQELVDKVKQELKEEVRKEEMRHPLHSELV